MFNNWVQLKDDKIDGGNKRKNKKKVASKRIDMTLVEKKMRDSSWRWFVHDDEDLQTNQNGEMI